MSFLERARERALAATDQLRAAAEHATGTPAPGMEPPTGVEGAPAPGMPAGATPVSTRDALQHSLEAARSSLASLVDRLDPSLVADVVIKATSVQERANAALHAKASPYRIDGISITATIPPQISFSIGRSAGTED